MDFIRSVAPVIVAGIVVVILVLVIKKKRKSGDKAETYMAEGIALGLCLDALYVRTKHGLWSEGIRSLKSKHESIVNVQNLNMTIIKEPDAKTQSR